MKRKLLLSTILIIILFNITGCFKNDDLEGSDITATTYPVEYLISRLYGEKSTIKSIYPNDTIVAEYDLTDKQIKKFSKETDLFIYNGLVQDKNRRLLILTTI